MGLCVTGRYPGESAASAREDLAARRRSGVAEIGRHRRDQRLHEIRGVGREDIGTQPKGLKFAGNNWTDRGDARSLQPLAQAIFATMDLRDLDQAANLA